MKNKIARARILELASQAHEGHIPSAFSILEILTVLYREILDVSAIRRSLPDRDRFILSKGHGSLALYVVLEECGLIDRAELDGFCRFNSYFGGHPHRSVTRGVEASTGSLGHGFPLAVGLALSLRQRKSPARVFVLVGDGECNEGSIWEAALLSNHHQLSNLVAIVDFNRSGDRAVSVDDLRDKFESFGFSTIEVDGHDMRILSESFRSLNHSDKPKMIIAHTVKGFGIREMENNPAWHHAFPTNIQMTKFLEELQNNA